MPKLKFLNVKTKKSFSTDKYSFTKKSNKRGSYVYFAVTTAPTGNKAYRIVSKDFYNKYK